MELDLDRIAEEADSSGEVYEILLRMQIAQANTPKRIIEPPMALKAFLNFVVDEQEELAPGFDRPVPKMAHLLEKFDEMYCGTGASGWPKGTWADPVRALGKKRLKLGTETLTVNQAVELVWKGKGSAILKFLDETVPRPDDADTGQRKHIDRNPFSKFEEPDPSDGLGVDLRDYE